MPPCSRKDSGESSACIKPLPACCHPLDAARVNYALMPAGVGMGQTTLKYESDRFESAVRVGAKRQSAIAAQKTLVATGQMGVSSPSSSSCDVVILSKLDSSDAISAKALRCVELIVPKDQVLGYTTSNWRNYRGDYTAYQPAPAKAPMTVKVIADETTAKAGEKAAVSVVSMRQ